MEALFWIHAALFIIPAYAANSTAMLLGGKTRLDFGRNFFDGQPILGKGKTVKGTAGGIAFGALATAAVFALFSAELQQFNPNYLAFGILAGTGAVFGDIAASFLKRRFMIRSGSPALILDQLDFVTGAYLFTIPLLAPSPAQVIFVAVFTVAVHMATNYIAFRLGLKKVPW